MCVIVEYPGFARKEVNTIKIEDDENDENEKTSKGEGLTFSTSRQLKRSSKKGTPWPSSTRALMSCEGRFDAINRIN